MISAITFRLSLLSLYFIGIFYGHLAEQAVCNSKKPVTVIFVLAAFFNLSFFRRFSVFSLSCFYSPYITLTFLHRAAVLFFIIILIASCRGIDLISKSPSSSLSFVTSYSCSLFCSAYLPPTLFRKASSRIAIFITFNERRYQ